LLKIEVYTCCFYWMIKCLSETHAGVCQRN
jgi:hypothetical protein